jgi:branched-chain amino acid transport system substrate-binding protein
MSNVSLQQTESLYAVKKSRARLCTPRIGDGEGRAMQGRISKFGSLVVVAAAIIAVGVAPFGGAARAADPIKVGAVSSLTGPMNWPESTAIARAVFDSVNAEGGIGGRKIEYIVEDDKFDPAVSGAAAHRLVDDQGVVGMVGSASVMECAVNAQYYIRSNIVSIPGTGIDPICFRTPNIAPVNTGPYLGIAVSLYYAATRLKLDHLCAFSPAVPSAKLGTDAAMALIKKLTGQTLLIDDRTVQGGDDLTQFVLKAQRAGCKAVLYAGQEPQVIAWMRAVKEQNVTGITWMTLTSAYTDKVAEVLGADGEGMYANSEFEPYLSSSPALDDWKNLSKEAKLPLSSFSEGGYVAATIFVHVLKSIKGEITRDSVTAAFRTLTDYKTPMIGTPFIFGPGKAHQPNHSSKMLRLHNGKWEVVTPEFVTLPNS